MSDTELDKARERLGTQIGHEETLINNRISWMLTTQGFLFAALGLVLKNADKLNKDNQNELITKGIVALVDLIPVLGGLIGCFVMFGIFAAYMSIDNHKNRTIDFIIEKCNGNVKEAKSKLKEFFPGGTTMASIIGRLVSLGIASTIVFSWIYFLSVIKQDGSIWDCSFNWGAFMPTLMILYTVIRVIMTLKRIETGK